jgi:hypothetical protein
MKNGINYSAILHWNNMTARIPTLHEVHDSKYSLSGGLKVLTSILLSVVFITKNHQLQHLQ